MGARRKSGITFYVIKNTYIGCLKKYLVIKGRARRREFWTFFFVNLVLGIIPVIGQIVILLTLIPGITVGVRRLHDTDRSGKWMLLSLFSFALLIVGLFIVFAGIFRGHISFTLFLIPIFIVSLVPIIILLVWAVQEGSRRRNRYGPDPKTSTRK